MFWGIAPRANPQKSLIMIKRVLRPDRLRQIPPSFSWVDHRLVRHHYLERCEPRGLALYLFLVTVADAQGLSYYSDRSISRCLRLDPLELPGLRQQLERAELIAYEKPLYQVLALSDPAGGPLASVRAAQTQSVGDILRRALGGGAA